MASSYTIIFIILLLYLFQVTGIRGAKFTIVNKCSQTIWPAVRANPGSPSLESTGFELPKGGSRIIQAPTVWSGAFWGRTGCTFNDSGQGSCVTGDCGSGQIKCNGAGAAAVTLAEFGLGPGSNDFYDVSLVLGYNLPLLVLVNGGTIPCPITGCVADLNQACPWELRTQDGGACQSPCAAFNISEFCCTGKYASTSTCKPTAYARMFKSACPRSYSYPYDDQTSLFTCPAAPASDYVITFCPSSATGKGMSPVQSPGYPPEGFSYHRTENGKNRTKEILIVVALSVTGAIIVSIIIVCFHKRRHSTSVPNQERNQDVEKFILQHRSLTPKRYKYSEIKKITKSFRDKLGQGGYGGVYKGMLPNGCLVAVKVLIKTDSNGEEFLNEVASISRTAHVNIVNLLGFCYDRNKRALVYEYMPNKSLDKFINNTDCHLDLEKLYKIAVGIAKGLEYLHTGCSTRIVHFDIKPQNILLDEDFCPKISDFGLAKLCKKKQSVLSSVLGTRGTIGYIAPEVFSRNFGGVSHKSDVYSYGMMVLEMAGARKIVETEVIQSSENYFPDKIYEQEILNVTRKLDDFMIEEEEETRRKMFLVGFWCIQTIPSDRPSMCKVVEMLEGSLQSIQIPPKPFLFSPNLPRQEISSSFSAYVETENSAQN